MKIVFPIQINMSGQGWPKRTFKDFFYFQIKAFLEKYSSSKESEGPPAKTGISSKPGNEF